MLTIDANIWVAAFDPRDRFHDRSVAFLRAVASARLRLHGPAVVRLEVACVVSRRAGNSDAGVMAHARLGSHPALVLHPVDERCLATAHALGVKQLLRGTDALYAATAAIILAPLISWDTELVERAGAMTPDRWLLDHA